MKNKIASSQSEMLLEGMNKEQKAAIVKTDGPVRILAGAGSGKTSVLTRKIAYLIQNKGINPSSILALTFTNKAANEMKERVEQLIGDVAKGMAISTFHSLCAKFLRYEIKVINGYDSRFVILDSTDQNGIIKEIYKKLDISATYIPINSSLEFISHHKINNSLPALNENIDDEDELKIENLKINVFSEYQTLLIKSKSLDFDDLLIFSRNILKNNPEILKKWQNKFEYFLVDEFQDTSQIQYEIIELMSHKTKNLTIVGDPDQTIYSWRGADINFINNFDKLFKKTTTITLNQNYRSSKNILKIANKLIEHNPNRLPKVLKTDNEEGPSVEYYQATSQENETIWVISKINQLKKNKVQLKDIVILYRSNFYSRSLEDGLIQEAVPHKIIGGQKFYERTEIKDAISFLRTIWEPNDITLKRIINIPARKIGPATLDKMIAEADKANMPLWDHWLKNIRDIKIPEESKKNLINFINITRKHKALIEKKVEIHLVLNSFLAEIGYLNLIKEDVNTNGNRLENITELLKSIKTWEEKHPEQNLDDYFESISLMSLNNSSEGANNLNYISMMTIHASKGMEFKNVFIIGLNEEIFPSYKSIEGDEKDIESTKMEEERRLAYVAITRAKERLFLSCSKGMFFDIKKPKQPSRFLVEMGFESGKSKDIYQEMESNSKTNRNFAPGDLINHTNFGEGVILDINGDTIVIEFKDKSVGVKSLLKNHKSIERI